MLNENQQKSNFDSGKKPILSLILCSRNDEYMGNSKWRLEITLNYIANTVYELGRENDVEIIVTDWGSKIPLHNVLQLNRFAKRLVTFINVPQKLAKELQKDSPFSEVHALNAAARRVKGQYIGRIDQDTLAGKIFFKKFFDLYEGSQTTEVPLDSALLFANRRSIPYRFAFQCPSIGHVDRFIRLFGSSLKVWLRKSNWPDVFWTSYVGIWMVHKDLWYECSGYDEQLIYYDLMEVDMISRLKQKYEVVDLGKLVNYDFYHLDHYPSRRYWSIIFANRKANCNVDFDKPPEEFHPNNDDWGLIGYPLEMISDSTKLTAAEKQQLGKIHSNWFVFAFHLLYAIVKITLDGIILSFIKIAYFFNTWWRRSKIVWDTISGKPLFYWPQLIKNLWQEKRNFSTE